MQSKTAASHIQQAGVLGRLSLLLITFVVACSDDPYTPEVPVPVASVQVAPDVVLLEVGGSHDLSATPRGAGGQPLSGRAIEWSSSNQEIATVSASGRVSAHAAGEVTVTARSEGRSGTALVTIRSLSPVPQIDTLTPDSTPASQGSLTLTITGAGFTPDSRVRLNGVPRPFTFVSSTELQAHLTSVDIGIPGTYEVTVVNLPPGGGVSNAVPFKVTAPLPPAVADISISVGRFDMEPEEWRQLGVTLRAADGSVLQGRPVTWSSSDSTVIHVHPTRGTAYGLRGGTVTITATSEGQVGQATLRIPEWLTFGLATTDGDLGPTLIRMSADTTERTEATLKVVERRVWLQTGRIDLSTVDGRYRQWFELHTTERTVTYFWGNVIYGEERLVGDARWVRDEGEITDEIDWIGNHFYRSSLFAGHRFALLHGGPGYRSIRQPVPGEGTQSYQFVYLRQAGP